jgi:hypothetical protein
MVTGAADEQWTAGLPAVLPLSEGQEWRQRLRSAAGAGSLWRADFVAGDQACAEVLVALEPAGAPAAEPGGPPPAAYAVPEILVVRALGPGSATWRLQLARPWSSAEPVAEHLLEVRVGPPA